MAMLQQQNQQQIYMQQQIMVLTKSLAEKKTGLIFIIVDRK